MAIGNLSQGFLKQSMLQQQAAFMQNPVQKRSLASSLANKGSMTQWVGTTNVIGTDMMMIYGENITLQTDEEITAELNKQCLMKMKQNVV